MYLWTVDSDNKLQPIGHTQARAKAGDLLIDPARGETYRLAQGRHDRLQMCPISPRKPAAEDQPIS